MKLAAAPTLAFKLRITDRTAEAIHSIMLRCQIQIEATRRSYGPGEQARLLDLFGPPDLWGRTLRSTLWMNTSLVVGSFTGSTVADLPVACTFDFNVAATKYFAGLDDGDVPLSLLFSGTIFFDRAGMLQVSQIPWEKEANCRLPVRTWREMMDLYYPDSAWLCLRREVFQRLCDYRRRHGLTSWEETIASALGQTESGSGGNRERARER